MGILEFHFHDAEFDFSPSMTTGGEDVETAFSDDSEAESETTEEPEAFASEESGNESSESAGVGALIALGVLVALAVLAGLRRRSTDSEPEPSEEVELEA
ncbi:hypothetical protein [Halobacterium bonnevillei]|uniref:Uncharacterized protein n=1 Tax=Halobacterium bonnevillei TaxID=2692200 RepID=A0A6B0SHR5_9EURY|nr:hypothetical protein [Halobacterium bonnevillei]MXR21208.1 hypothetical protein [Halobacterium bonnevillei]